MAQEEREGRERRYDKQKGPDVTSVSHLRTDRAVEHVAADARAPLGAAARAPPHSIWSSRSARDRERRAHALCGALALHAAAAAPARGAARRESRHT